MTRRILHVVSNVDRFGGADDGAEPTGLWLSELTHAWDRFAEAGFEQRLVSPDGGRSPLEPRSLRWPLADATAKAWLAESAHRDLLETTAAPIDIDPAEYDAIWLTGGHAVMWDFPDSPGLQRIIAAIDATGGVVGAVCHGYCGLLNVKRPDGRFFVEGRRLTGFSWREEVLAGVARRMPYDAEAEIKGRGARYEKGLLPFAPFVVVDDRLVTGQNPFSARAAADAVVEVLG